MMNWSRTEGEVLFFSEDGTLKRMLSALCGVSGEADTLVRPRLCITDADARSREQCMECAGVNRAAVLFLGDDPPDSVAGTIYHLPRPFLFSDFTRLLGEIFSGSAKTVAVSAVPLTRLVLDPDGWAVYGERRCHVSPAEAKVLHILLKSAPAPVSRQMLAQVFAGQRGNGVDVYISYLRRKLRELTPNVGIVSVRGRGYALIGGETVQNESIMEIET
jgi:hypothetical protein